MFIDSREQNREHPLPPTETYVQIGTDEDTERSRRFGTPSSVKESLGHPRRRTISVE